MKKRRLTFAWWRTPTSDPEGMARAQATEREVRTTAARLRFHLDENHLGEALDAAFGAGRK